MSEPHHEEVKRFVYEHPDPAVSTQEVWEGFNGVSKKTIFNRLDDLSENGKLEKKMVGADTAIWFTENYVSASASASKP